MKRLFTVQFARLMFAEQNQQKHFEKSQKKNTIF